MATLNPRIQVMLDTETSNLLTIFAAQHNRSLSATAADLIREALELQEDMLFSKHGDARLSQTTEWFSHEEAWQQ
jgi:hypothetical protein